MQIKNADIISLPQMIEENGFPVEKRRIFLKVDMENKDVVLLPISVIYPHKEEPKKEEKPQVNQKKAFDELDDEPDEPEKEEEEGSDTEDPDEEHPVLKKKVSSGAGKFM